MTLGLIEVWYDTLAQGYLNVSPPRNAIRKDPTRFELHVLTHAEVLDFLDKIYNLLDRFCASGYHSLLTVSPVPLAATFTTTDVIMANQYSKSTLRSAAQELVEKRSNVDYYPSYESLIISDRHLAWADDMRHPTSELVTMNVTNMINAYTDCRQDDVATEIGLKQAFEQHDFHKSVDIAHALLEIDDTNVLALTTGSRAAIRLRLWSVFEMWRDQMQELHKKNPNGWTVPINFIAARVFRKPGAYEEAKNDYAEFPDTFAKLRELVTTADHFSDYEFVLELCEAGLKQFKRNATLCYYGGKANFAVGKLDEAKSLTIRYLDMQNDASDRGQKLLKEIEDALKT